MKVLNLTRLLTYCIGLQIVCAITYAQPSNHTPVQRLDANLGLGCHFAVTLPGEKGVRVPSNSDMTAVAGNPEMHQGGMVAAPYPPPWRSSLPSIGFNLDCNDKDDPDAASAPTNYTGAKYDKQKKIWDKDLDAWFPTDKLTGEERKIADKATRVMNIQAINSRGFAQLTDDTIGDELGRRRNMNFCLFHPPKALCGQGTVAMLADGPKGDLTKYALEILRSIEFLADATTTQPTSAK